MKKSEYAKTVKALEEVLTECFGSKLICRTLANGIISTFKADLESQIEIHDDEAPSEKGKKKVGE